MYDGMYWFGNLNASTGAFINYYPASSYTLTYQTNSILANVGSEDMAVFGVTNPIDLTNATKVKVMFSGTINGRSDRYLFLNICIGANISPRAKELGLYNHTNADITYTDYVFEIDVSDLTGSYYPCIQWAPNVSGETDRPLTVSAFVIE